MAWLMACRLVCCPPPPPAAGSSCRLGGGERLAVLGDAVNQLADQVLAVLAAPFGGQLAPVLEDLEGRQGPDGQVLVPVAGWVVEQDVGVVGVGIADDGVAPVDQLAGVVGGHVEQPGEDLDGEVGADLLDEVELRLAQRLGDGGGGEAAQEFLVALEHAAAEVPLQQLAHGLVTGPVAFQHGPAQRDVVVVDLLEVDEPGQGERLRVAVDHRDVGVPGHGPEAVVGGGLRVEEGRRLPAQGIEPAPGLVTVSWDAWRAPPSSAGCRRPRLRR